MKYLIIGSGAIGSCIGGFLTSVNKDVSFISRGEKLKYLKENGLRLKTDVKGDFYLPKVKAYSEAEYSDKADVIFVCVKTYSFHNVLELIKKASHKNTIVIPTANGFGNGNRLSKSLPELHLLDGCVYIFTHIDGIGSVVQKGNFFRFVFGPRKDDPIDSNLLNQVENDLKESGITGILSKDIELDTFRKFTFISTFAACGAYYDITSKEMQEPGKYRDTFIELCKEIEAVGKKLGLKLDMDITADNLKIVDNNTPDTTSSMQRDIKEGKQSEIDSIVFEVVRLAEKLGVEAPAYKRIAEHFGYKN
ncbi:MAG: ketopantoate reductase family protein [Solirubrobacterales bacterium]